ERPFDRPGLASFAGDDAANRRFPAHAVTAKVRRLAAKTAIPGLQPRFSLATPIAAASEATMKMNSARYQWPYRPPTATAIRQAAICSTAIAAKRRKNAKVR